MPLKKCVKNGKSGWKWGDAGVCYIGANARDKALKQGIAVLTSEAIKAGAKTKKEIDEYITNHSSEL